MTLSEMILEPLLEDLLCKMLEIYPKKRITCFSELNHTNSLVIDMNK